MNQRERFEVSAVLTLAGCAVLFGAVLTVSILTPETTRKPCDCGRICSPTSFSCGLIECPTGRGGQ